MITGSEQFRSSSTGKTIINCLHIFAINCAQLLDNFAWAKYNYSVEL